MDRFRERLNKEGAIITRDTDAAAVFRFFELELNRHNPAIIVEEIKWSDLQKGIKPKNPPKRITWKFNRDDKAIPIAQAFDSQTAHQDFDAFVETLPIEQEQKDKLKALHSASVARAGGEICKARHKLVAFINSDPKNALWQAIVYDDGTIKSMFPKAASP